MVVTRSVMFRWYSARLSAVMSLLNRICSDWKPRLNSSRRREPADAHAVGAAVDGLDVLFPFRLRVVKLLRVGVHQHVVVRQLAEVDARLLDVDVAGHRRLRRDVLHEQNRQSLLRHFVHRPERDAVAVREGEVLVDPRAVRQALGIQLARREHHLPQLAVDRVAIVVDRREVVVGAQLLDLAEGLEQRLVIPEAHVLDGVGVAVDVFARQRRVAGEIARPHGGEIERLPRSGDVVRHVRRFGRLFVRRDDEALDARGVERSANRSEEIQADGERHRPHGGGKRVIRRKAGRQQRNNHQHARGGHPRHDIGVGGAGHDAGPRHIGQQVRHFQVRAGGEQQEERRDEQRQMQPRLADDRDAAALREVQRACQHVRRRRTDERHDDDGDADLLHQIEQRQPEHVEADVVSEDGIVDAERHGVLELEPAHPLAAAGQADHQRHDQGADADDLANLLAPDHRRLHGARGARADDDVGARDGRDGDPQVAVEHRRTRSRG